jgi:hypothetical protein
MTTQVLECVSLFFLYNTKHTKQTIEDEPGGGKSIVRREVIDKTKDNAKQKDCEGNFVGQNKMVI